MEIQGFRLKILTQMFCETFSSQESLKILSLKLLKINNGEKGIFPDYTKSQAWFVRNDCGPLTFTIMEHTKETYYNCSRGWANAKARKGGDSDCGTTHCDHKRNIRANSLQTRDFNPQAWRVTHLHKIH